jgi:excisionase family DNA binding protein
MIQAMGSDETYLRDKKAAAKYLGVSLGTIDRMVMTGRGPRYVKVGNLVRFRIEDLAAFVEANTRGGRSSVA